MSDQAMVVYLLGGLLLAALLIIGGLVLTARAFETITTLIGNLAELTKGVHEQVVPPPPPPPPDLDLGAFLPPPPEPPTNHT